MPQVGIREFRTHISAIMRRVRDDGEIFEITRRGKVVARLRPIHPWEKAAADGLAYSDADRIAFEEKLRRIQEERRAAAENQDPEMPEDHRHE
ncbi:MAG: type II toxin-antitoxin system prevent-host-death family antitoxin [Thermomicrobiales bacterium]|nr:type II toxin-antitoxin system prevent-host-death family antitoxin [Thermomicrobiales bacterium]